MRSKAQDSEISVIQGALDQRGQHRPSVSHGIPAQREESKITHSELYKRRRNTERGRLIWEVSLVEPRVSHSQVGVGS